MMGPAALRELRGIKVLNPSHEGPKPWSRTSNWSEEIMRRSSSSMEAP